jgi:iron complex outermembrane receptor protein
MRNSNMNTKVFFIKLCVMKIMLILTGSVSGQSSMEEMVVTGNRAETELGEVAASLSVINQDIIQTAEQQLTLEESLKRVPGVFLQNSHNFSQAQRISIRGFGARSPFGIRGIKLIVDGVPATMPDGQGNVDEIDLGSAKRIEVLRGPSSSLYGTASGGVIHIISEDGPEDPFVEGRISLGDYGFRQYQLKTGGQADKLNYMLSGAVTDLDGYRDNAFMERRVFNTKLTYQIDPKGSLTANVNVLDIPELGDPGALRENEVEDNREAAAPNNLRFNGGENRSQQRFGLSYRRQLTENQEVSFRNHYTFLDFNNSLPFSGGVAESNGGQVSFDRTYMGGGAQYTYYQNVLDVSLRFIAGFDVDFQKDDRQRFVNMDDGIRGELTFDELEEVFSVGAYMQSEFALLEDLQLILGARWDDVEFTVTDRFFDNNSGDDSGKRNFDRISPRLGLMWDPAQWVNMFFNFSTAFETPTTTEFANPDGGGFNQNLTTQIANNYELGMKGFVAGGIPLNYEVAVFWIEVTGELVPFEEDDLTGRTFFRNAAKSTRGGLEAGLSAELFPSFTASLAYSYIDADFDRFRTASETFSGNSIPGVPNQHLHAELRYDQEQGLYSVLDLLYVDSFYADNANQVEADSYAVSNFRLGYRKELENWIFTPYVSVNNIFNEKYNSNVRLNGGFGRFFEPAPLRNIYGGVSARYTF